MGLKANWLWIVLLILGLLALWSEGVFGQETPHPSGFCEYQELFQTDILPNLNDPNLVKEVIKYKGFTYNFYSDKKTEKVKIVIARHINLITGEINESWTWQDGDLIITTKPQLKWNFCIILMKKYKGQNLDLTHLKDVMTPKLQGKK